VVQKRHELACCAINVAEVYADMRAPETEKTEALLLSLDYVPISWEASKLAGELRQEWAAFLLPALPP
jgi:predicted nucleic acid-binding protein